MPDQPQFLPVVDTRRDAGAPPIFDKIAIVGLGLIGGSIALAARQLWPQGLVIAVDRKDVLEKAMVMHAVDVAAGDLTIIAEADLVVLAAPIRQNIELLAKLPDYVAGAAIVTDTGSTKRSTVAAARALPPRFAFVGGHPLGGAARSGIELARPDLFAGRPWIFTPESDAAGEVLSKLDDFVRALGAEPRVLSPAEHDRILAYISHLPQLTASALMHIIGEQTGDEGLAMAGRGLIDTTRLASSPAEIWRDVCATNADHIRPALDTLIDILRQLRDDLTRSDTLDKVYASANKWRDRLKREG